jgi:hypothetical protein
MVTTNTEKKLSIRVHIYHGIIHYQIVTELTRPTPRYIYIYSLLGMFLPDMINSLNKMGGVGWGVCVCFVVGKVSLVLDALNYFPDTLLFLFFSFSLSSVLCRD